MAWLVMIFLFGLASGVASSPASSTDATCKTCQKIIGEADAVDTAALLQSRTHVEEKTAIQKAAALRDEAPDCSEIVAYQDTQGNPWSKLPQGSSYQQCQETCEAQGDEWTLFTFWPGRNGCRCSKEGAPSTNSKKKVISGPLNCRKACIAQIKHPNCGKPGWEDFYCTEEYSSCEEGFVKSSTETGCCEACGGASSSKIGNRWQCKNGYKCPTGNCYKQWPWAGHYSRTPICCEACTSGHSWWSTMHGAFGYYTNCGAYGRCCETGYAPDKPAKTGGCCQACTCNGRPQTGKNRCGNCEGCIYTDGQCKAR